jgi:thiamine transport system substrate-binding protein
MRRPMLLSPMLLSPIHRTSRWALASAAVLLALAACSSDIGAGGGTAAGSTPDPSVTVAPPASFPPTTITLLAHDSFAVSKQVLADFEARTGITVKVVTGGDAGEVVNKAVLTAGDPEGDVLFGVDNTLLSRAVDAGIFAPYRSAGLVNVRPDLRALVTGDTVTPVDYGDVCVNVDDKWFATRGIAPPTTLADLAEPKYKNLLVVENPATSSPGLVFLLATIARYGKEDWKGYWDQMKANGVKVDDGWTQAYEGDFSGGGNKGSRPLVVSYASSPPAEIVYATDPKPTNPSTSVMTDGCFRQVEFVGVLKGTRHEQAARAFVDFMLSQPFQRDEPLSMFVDPSVVGTPLPEVFTKWAATPTDSLSIPPAEITANRETWVDDWTQAVLH